MNSQKERVITKSNMRVQMKRKIRIKKNEKWRRNLRSEKKLNKFKRRKIKLIEIFEERLNQLLKLRFQKMKMMSKRLKIYEIKFLTLYWKTEGNYCNKLLRLITQNNHPISLINPPHLGRLCQQDLLVGKRQNGTDGPDLSQISMVKLSMNKSKELKS